MDKRLLLDVHTAQFVVQYLNVEDDIIENVIYLQRSCCDISCATTGDDDWTDARAVTQATDVLATWSSDVMPYLSQDVRLTSCVWSWNPTVNTGPVHTGVVNRIGGPLNGGISSQAMAAGIAKAIRCQSGLAGRSYRGRIFLPGIPVAYGTTDEQDLLNSTGIANLTTVATGLFAGLNSNDCVAGIGTVVTWGVASFRHNLAPRPSAVFTPYSAANLATDYVDYQRRRSLGHSRHH